MLARARDHVGAPVLTVLVLLALTPLVVTSASTQSVVVTAMVYAIGAVGLDVMTGYSGQFSFGQFVYFAVGAYVMSALAANAQWPWYACLLAGVVAAGLLAGVVGSALVRLKFFGSAVGTFFMGAVALDLLNGQRLAEWTGGPNGIPSPQAVLGGTPLNTGTALYYTVLVALAIAAAVCLRYTRTRAGIAARVIKENEVVAAVMGIRVIREKVRIQIFAGALAGLGGCTLAINLGYLSPDSFNVVQSIELFAIVVVGGIGSIAGPIVGALFFFGAVNGFAALSGSASDLFLALVLLLVVVFFHGGLYDCGERLWRLVARPWRHSRPPAPPARADGEVQNADDPDAPDVPAPRAPAALRVREVRCRPGDVLLDIADVSVDFGGVKALDGVSLQVRRGEVHALIGPNGAGKTTLLNCVSGIQRLSSGSITFDGRDLAGLSVSSRRQLGISRTFQHPSLVSDLDALRNVTIGAFDSHDGSVWAELVGTPSTRRRRRAAADRAAQALDTLEFPRKRWHSYAGDITMGEQKHVDIARAVAGGPALLLLDEPTAGLGVEEVAAVANAIRAVRDAGVTILVIAHHVGFIRQIADRCTVLDFGRPLISETPEQVLNDARVLDVFVGTGDAA